MNKHDIKISFSAKTLVFSYNVNRVINNPKKCHIAGVAYDIQSYGCKKMRFKNIGVQMLKIRVFIRFFLGTIHPFIKIVGAAAPTASTLK